MKFWAKVRFNSAKDAEHLIRSFFKEFNPENRVVIRGKEAKVEIIFDEPPVEIIQAIGECELLEFHYGKPLREYNEDETISSQLKKHKEVSNDETQVVISEQEKMSAEEAVCKQSANPESNNANEVKKSDKYAEEIPELIQLANKSRSYEEFVNLVADWLEIGERKEFFKNLLVVANQTKKIIWSNLEEILNAKNISYSFWDKVWCTKQVANKFKNAATHITIAVLIKEILKYKDYNFNHEINMEKEDSSKKQAPINESIASNQKAETVEKELLPDEKSEIVKETISFNEEEDSSNKPAPINESIASNQKAETVEKELLPDETSEIVKETISSNEEEDSSNKPAPIDENIDSNQKAETVEKELLPDETSEIVKETISSNEEIEVPKEGPSVLETIEKPKIKVKMACMPEIPYFEEVLSAVDKTKTIEERVKYVLMAMKLDKLNAKDQDGILKIAVTAVESKEISYDTIFKTVRIPFESIGLARMTFSAFINDFIATYDPTRKVKLLDFLKDLQTIVI